MMIEIQSGLAQVEMPVRLASLPIKPIPSAESVVLYLASSRVAVLWLLDGRGLRW